MTSLVAYLTSANTQVDAARTAAKIAGISVPSQSGAAAAAFWRRRIEIRFVVWLRRYSGRTRSRARSPEI